MRMRVVWSISLLLMMQVLLTIPQLSMSAAAAQGDDCNIDSDGYCIFTGTPHQTGLQPGTNDIVDRQGDFLFHINRSVAADSAGEVLQASGKPAFDGDDLIEHSQANLNEDEKAFHKVMAVMYPIRNALMYDIADLSQSQWDILVTELEVRDIKESTYTGGPTPKDNYYGRQGVFDLARDPGGQDITHEVMKFLEEASIYLLCHVTSDEFNQMLHDNHPEGHDPCSDAGISTKMPFDSDDDETITVNHVVLVDTPPHKEWEWNYSYQVEVSDLQMDVNYTAVILIKQIGNDEWGSLDWWWDDIESDGDQFDHPIMLQRGCYFINASLFEKEDLNSDAENATVLASADLDFVVGTGACVDGVYSEDSGGGDNVNQTDDPDGHCLTVDNLTVNATLFITLDLVNICEKDIHYPGVNATADNPLVSGFLDMIEWYYLIFAETSYPHSWQLVLNETIPNGTEIILTFEAEILNCGVPDNWHDCPDSVLQHTFTVGESNDSVEPETEPEPDDPEICMDHGQERLCANLWLEARTLLGMAYLETEPSEHIVGADDGWATINITMQSLTRGKEYTLEWKVKDNSVTPPVDMYCNKGPSMLRNGTCADTTVFVAEGDYLWLIHLPALEDSTNACVTLTLSANDVEPITVNGVCWTQKSASDWDQDGVYDPVDECAATPSGSVVDDDGCTAEQKASQVNADGDDTSDQSSLGAEEARPASVPGFSMVTATIGLVLGAIIIATRREEDSQTSLPLRPDNSS